MTATRMWPAALDRRVDGLQNLLVVGDPTNYLVASRIGMPVEQIQTLFDQATGASVRAARLVRHCRNGADSINDLGWRVLNDT